MGVEYNKSHCMIIYWSRRPNKPNGKKWTGSKFFVCNDFFDLTWHDLGCYFLHSSWNVFLPFGMMILKVKKGTFWNIILHFECSFWMPKRRCRKQLRGKGNNNPCWLLRHINLAFLKKKLYKIKKKI